MASTRLGCRKYSPFVFSRAYLSSDARIGVLGQGWSIPGEGLTLEANDTETVLIDAQGRRIRFGPLDPGESRFSPTERLWIRRGGPVIPQRDALAPWSGRWAGVPEDVRHDPTSVVVLAGGDYFHFRVDTGQGRLAARFDRNGYHTEFGWARLPGDAEGETGPRVLAHVRDSAGRRYGFAYRPGRRSALARGRDPGVRLVGVALLEGLDPRTPAPDDVGADWLVRYDYDDADNLRAVYDRGGALVRHFEWAAHMMVAHARPGGFEVRYAWDRLHPEGRLIARTLPDASRWQYRLDPETGDMLGTDGPEGLAWKIERDARGNTLTVTAPDGATTRFEYDVLGRLVAQIHPDRTRETLSWHPTGRLAGFMDAGGLTQRFRYDAAGRLIALINENEAESRFEYDAMDRIVREIGFDGRTQLYAYDAAGRLTARTEASLPEAPVTAYEHDALGRLVARHLPATASAPAITEHFRWRSDGQLAGFGAPQAEVSFGFDAAGRSHLETQHHTDGWCWQVAHRHTEQGAVQSSRLGQAPEVQWLTYGPGHLHGVRCAGLAIDFERDRLHRELDRIVRPAARTAPMWVEVRTYSTLGQLARSRLEPAVGAARVRDYRYDALGRLAASRHGAETRAYRFDAAGNRLDPPQAHRANEPDWAQTVAQRLSEPDFNVLGQSHAAQSGAACWPDNRVLTLAGARNHYDAAGNLVEQHRPDGTQLTLGYDGAHRLVTLTRREPDGTLVRATYAYDALSRCISKTVTDTHGSTTTTRYGWDGERLVGEDDGTRTTTIVYEPDRFTPLLRFEQPTTHEAGTDPEPRETDTLIREATALLATHGLPLPPGLHDEPPEATVSVFLCDHLGTPLQLTDRDGQTYCDYYGGFYDASKARQP